MATIGLNRNDALSILETSKFDFYLGGSRRMAQRQLEQMSAPEGPLDDLADIGCPLIELKPTTDYDFYCTYNTDVERFLIDHNFTDTVASIGAKHANPNYLDTEAIRILERDGVQIVLRDNALFYRQVFESISISFYYDNLWKSSPGGVDEAKIQPIFNALFAVAHAFKPIAAI
jgi:hypothetical protein